MYGLAIRPPKDSDAQKTSDVLHNIEAEDPSLQVEHNAALNEVVLRGFGELHLRTVLELIADRYNLEVDTALPSIAYRETITEPAEGHHRHKKQTGGAGQFGEVYLRVEPLPRGSGFEFESAVVGGSIPSQYIPAVETGVRQVMQSGANYGYPMQDIKVTVYDGKHHSVDSKEIAFVQAGKKGVPGSHCEGVSDHHGTRRGCHRHGAKSMRRRGHRRSVLHARHGKRYRSATRRPHCHFRQGTAQGNAGVSFAVEVANRRRRSLHDGLQSLCGSVTKIARCRRI